MMSITHPLPTQSLNTKKRVPVVLQSEAAECGLACMTMIAQYYSDKRDLNALRQTMSVSLRGTTLKDVMRIASDLGFQTRAIKIEMEHLAQLSCPAILHWNMNHFVVLTKVKGKTLTIHDPALGESLPLLRRQSASRVLRLKLHPVIPSAQRNPRHALALVNFSLAPQDLNVIY